MTLFIICGAVAGLGCLVLGWECKRRFGNRLVSTWVGLISKKRSKVNSIVTIQSQVIE